MRSYNIKTIARWALVVFVMAWFNLVIQAPLHAAMKQEPLPAPCCVEDAVSLCDLVLSMESQADDALGAAALDPVDFQIAFVTVAPVQPVKAVVSVDLRMLWLDVRQYAPPPLLLKTTLLI